MRKPVCHLLLRLYHIDSVYQGKIARLLDFRHRALARQALGKDELTVDDDVIRDLVADGIADLEVVRVDRRDERDLDERLSRDAHLFEWQDGRAERSLRERGEALLVGARTRLARHAHLEVGHAGVDRLHADLMADVPLDGVEVREQRRLRAVRVDLIVDGVDARHHAAASVRAVVVLLELVDAVDERARLDRTVRVLLDGPELVLDRLRRSGRRDAHGRDEEDSAHDGADELAEFHVHSPL